MKESIYSIPVSEVFEPRTGCPLCRLDNMLEERAVEYILGAAMMEPDVRVVTNEKGFCPRHYRKMSEHGNKLPLALVLKSHLEHITGQIEKDAAAKKPVFGKGQLETKAIAEGCFICDEIQSAREQILANTAHLFGREAEFRELFSTQEFLCFPHFAMLLDVACRALPSKSYQVFAKAAAALTKKPLEQILGDVTHFCNMFDYRNARPDADWGNSRDSIPRAIGYLTGERR